MAVEYAQLTLKERYNIEFLIQEGFSNKSIALRLCRDKSTIGREIKRNSNSRISYSAEVANMSATRRCKREIPSKFTLLSKDIIEDKLGLKWSPEQISSHLKSVHSIFISHELIYQYIDNNRKSGGNLYKLLPHRGKKYKKRNIKTRKKYPKSAVERKSISSRPAEVSQKTRIGHWEGDTVESKGHRGGIATLVDIKSKYTVIRKVRDKSSIEMKSAVVESFTGCPELIKTLTVDNGNEFALHDKISKELNTDVYFAHPYSPWERGLNENTNGLIRRFYPKGTDFTKISERELIKVQNLLNERPRKVLGFKTPKEVFTEEMLKEEKYRKMLKAM